MPNVSIHGLVADWRREQLTVDGLGNWRSIQEQLSALKLLALIKIIVLEQMEVMTGNGWGEGSGGVEDRVPLTLTR